MNISKFQNIKISEITEQEKPTDIVTIDPEGNLKKSPIRDHGRIVEGGAAETVYLSHQNIDGGSAITVSPYKINGGGA